MQPIRAIVFLFGCIGTRLFIALTAKYINPDYLPYMGALALLVSLSFIYLYFVGNKTADAQLQWLGDKTIWWNDLRIVHGLIYLLFAIYAFQSKPFSWMVLFFDVLLGLTAWLLHHQII